MSETDLELSFNIACTLEISFDLETFTRKILHLRQITQGSFEFTFVDRDTIKELNQAHLDHDYVTDIITFNLGSTDDIVGDVYICAPHAKDNADHYGQVFDDEIRLLIIHGILHLLNYQDYTDDERAVMDAEQRRLLAGARQ